MIVLFVFLGLVLPASAFKDPCPTNFTFFMPRWCVLVDSSFNFDMYGAEQRCASLGLNAPSIHSYQDWLDWSNISGFFSHFWLALECPKEGDPYTWHDGTPTDYYGPHRELAQCKKGQGYHMHPNGFQKYGTDINQQNYYTAPALCAFDVDATTTTSTTTPTTTTPTTTTPSTTTSTTTPSTTTSTTTPTTTTQTTTTPSTTTSTTTPTTITSTTTPATTTSTTITSTNPPTTQPLPDLTAEYCTCNAKTIYLDIVFVTDVSSDMTEKSVGDATALIQSILFGLSFGTAKFTSQVATIAFADKVEIVTDFGVIRNETDILYFSLPYRGGKAKTMASAIDQASSLISANARSFTRGVIVLMSKSFDQLDAVNIQEASESFKDDGGVFITIDYSKGKINGLEQISSDGYYLNFNKDPDSLPKESLIALCDANCFCSEGLTPYDTTNVRKTPQGCYHPSVGSAVFAAADNNCQKEKGFIATSHDSTKDFFLQSLFTPGSKYWIGYTRVNGQFRWEDNSSEGACNWASGYPRNNPGEDCVYSKPLGFNSQCYSEQCSDPMNASMRYACQLRPCDSTYDCWQ